MELTQIQGQNPGKKVNLNQVNNFTIWSANWNAIQNPNIPNEAAKIESSQWGRNITPTQWSPVFINWQQIRKTSPISHWDTISVWNNNQVVLWAHPAWTNLWPASTGQHLWKLNFSPDDISDITYKMFNFKENKEILRPLVVLLAIIVVLFILTAVSLFKISWIKDGILKEKKDVLSKISEINLQLETASSLVWLSFFEDSFSECEEDDEECETSQNQEKKSSIKSRIEDAEKTLSNLKNEQKKAIKLLEDSVNKITWDWIILIEEKIDTLSGDFENLKKDDLEKFFPKKDKENFKERYKNKSVFEIVSKLDDVFGQTIVGLKKEIKSSSESTKKDVKNFSEFKNDLRQDISKISDFSSDFEAEKTNTKQKFTTLDNKNNDNQKEIQDLKKRNDKLDVEIKKLNEEINSLEIKIKNISK